MPLASLVPGLALLEGTCRVPACERQQVRFRECRPNLLIRTVVERFRKEDKELQIAVQKQAYNVDLCPLMERNLALLRSGECLDLTIRCGSHEYRLHRVMVCPQSANGQLCRNGKFKVSSSPILSLCCILMMVNRRE